MGRETGKNRVLGLFSGGLDSRLAVRLLQEQGLEVSCVHFRTGFVKEERREVVERTLATCSMRLDVVDIRGDYLALIREPRHGYGSGMNPCADCRVLMLQRAAELAREHDCEWLFTGEVIGQRAKDQSRAALLRIERDAGVAGRVLRPLSAAHLEPLAVESDGGIERDRLERLHGSARRGQLELARRLGVEPSPTPSGGCCWLARPAFARRLRDHLQRTERVADEDVELLKLGRHFRLAWNLKLIVGRDEAESRRLVERAGERRTCQEAGRHGPVGLLVGEAGGEPLVAAARVVARYGRLRNDPEVKVEIRGAGQVEALHVAPAGDEETANWRL